MRPAPRCVLCRLERSRVYWAASRNSDEVSHPLCSVGSGVSLAPSLCRSLRRLAVRTSATETTEQADRREMFERKGFRRGCGCCHDWCLAGVAAANRVGNSRNDDSLSRHSKSPKKKVRRGTRLIAVSLFLPPRSDLLLRRVENQHCGAVFVVPNFRWCNDLAQVLPCIRNVNETRVNCLVYLAAHSVGRRIPGKA